MEAEIAQLKLQNTQDLVDLPCNRKALKGRQVYKIKTDQFNKLIKYKARWVVKGYSQAYGLDYFKTFANTTRIEIIRFLLYLAAWLDLEIMQQDFKNAFLHAPIDSKIYVQQPIRFNTANKTKVCKLLKSLYGLKQAPRAWYNYLANILKQLEYYPIFAEQGIFYNKDTKTYIIVQVDDILVLSSSLQIIEELKQNLLKLLELSNLGKVSLFLGIEITRDRKNRSISLKQTKYIKTMLEKFNKQHLNPVSIIGQAT